MALCLAFFEYIGDHACVLDPLIAEARDSRIDVIEDYYRARLESADEFGASNNSVYRPTPPTGALFIRGGMGCPIGASGGGGVFNF